MRRGKLTRKQRLRIKADNLYSKAVLARDRYCAVCGLRASDPHHIVKKSRSEFLRYDMKNSIGLSRNCHRKVEDRNPFVLEILAKKLGDERIMYLDRHRHKLVKYNVRYLEENIERLKKEVRKWTSH